MRILDLCTGRSQKLPPKPLERGGRRRNSRSAERWEHKIANSAWCGIFRPRNPAFASEPEQRQAFTNIRGRFLGNKQVGHATCLIAVGLDKLKPPAPFNHPMKIVSLEPVDHRPDMLHFRQTYYISNRCP